MNKITFKNLILAVSMSLLVTHVSAQSSDYDFRYVANGAPSITPLQVFDDGQFTYIQMPVGALQPAIFATGTAGKRLLHGVVEGNYIKIDGIYGHLTIQHGTNTISNVQYSGPGRTTIFKNSSLDSNRAYAAPIVAEATKVRYTAAPALAGDEMVNVNLDSDTIEIPFLRNSSNLSTRDKSQLSKFAKNNKNATIIKIDANDLDGEKQDTGFKRALAVKSYLVSKGISPDTLKVQSTPTGFASTNARAVITSTRVVSSPIVAKQPSNLTSVSDLAPTNHANNAAAVSTPLIASSEVAIDAQPKSYSAPMKSYAFSQGDRSLRGALNRWAKEEGWVLEWEAERDHPLPPGSFNALSIKEAALKAMEATQNSDYPLRAVFMDDVGVVVIKHNQRETLN